MTGRCSPLHDTALIPFSFIGAPHTYKFSRSVTEGCWRIPIIVALLMAFCFVQAGP